MVSGLIAESIAIPVLLTAIVTNHNSMRWGYVAAAIGCIVVSVVYLALFVVTTKGKAGVNAKANLGFIVVCLALASLGFVELAASNRWGTYLPTILVGVVFVSVIGDRRMRVCIGIYSIALVTVISWGEGLRGSDLAAAVIVYAATITVISVIASRAVGSLTGDLNVRQAIDALNETFEDLGPTDAETGAELMADLFRRGLPLVTGILPAEQATVYAHNAALGRFVPLASWPSEGDAGPLEADRPELVEALRSDAVVLNELHCAIPVGYCVDGELVMMVKRAEAHRHVDHHSEEAARLLASTFLRVTSRANFVSGLQTESRTDPLTGLANRRSLYERIEIEMAHALRSETPLSVAMIDLDHFKHYNDQFGHVAGDTLLRSIAAVMVSNIRGQDLVARYGGEEFCLVMPDTDLVGGHHLLDQLRTGGRDATSELGITLSAGLTSWDGIEDATSFIERADQALYKAKESGRNRVVSIQAFTEF
jgi:diguanylate cyclase (GGDEF)-like protein